jgi:hypothetical protein
MGYLIVTSRITPDLFEKSVKKLGWKKTLDELIKYKQPKYKNLRRGEFGESLSAAILDELYSYEIPVYKLRYTLDGDISLKGTDLVALKLKDDEIVEVCFVESKLRTTTRTGIAVEAYDQLMNDATQEMPPMITFMSDRLREMKHHASDSFDNYMFDRSDMRNTEKYCIVLVCDKDNWSDTTLKNLEQHIQTTTRRIHVECLKIQDLKSLSDQVFSSIGVEKALDDE